MTAAARRSRGVTAAVVVASTMTLVLTGLGMWARAQTGPLWPTMLTDWSLGSALLAFSAAGVGAVVAVRLPRNIVAWLFVAIGLLTSVVFSLREVTAVALSVSPAPGVATWAAWAFAWVIPINMTCLALLALLFPYATTPSRRWRMTALLIVVTGAAATTATVISPYSPDQTPFPSLDNPTAVVDAAAGRSLIETTSSLVLLGLIIAAVGVVVRLRRARGTERQQLKWFCFASVVAVVTFISGFWVAPLFIVATLVALPAVPIAAGVAVLRHRLYDIDRVINRTVVYGAVTAVLAVAYAVAVTVLRAATAPVTGDSAVAVAASTLAVAALFRPVRGRVQRAVDRRFNRARYDAEQIAGRYRARLRDELDLGSLEAELLATVASTVQPTTAALWLAPAQGAAR